MTNVSVSIMEKLIVKYIIIKILSLNQLLLILKIKKMKTNLFFIKKSVKNSAMLKTVAVCMCILSSLMVANAQKSIGIDFAGVAYDNPGNWNLSTAEEPSITSLKELSGIVTSMGLKSIDYFCGYYVGAGTVGGDAEGFTPAVSGTYAFGNAVDFNGESIDTVRLELTGMDKDIEYNFDFYSSRKGVTDNRESLFILMGATTESVTVNSASNTTVVSSKVKPKSDGTIYLKVCAGPNNAHSNGFYYLNGMIITYDSNSAIGDVDASQACSLYPNPAKNMVTFNLAQSSSVNVYTLSGKIVMQKMLEAGETSLPLELSTGLYLVDIVGADNSIMTKRLLVE